MPPSRLNHLDHIRAFAALIVCFSHFKREAFGTVTATSLPGILHFGSLGVEIFFVLSGFVIPLSLSQTAYRAKDFGVFMASRFLRLYPAFFAAGAASIVLWYSSSLIPGFQGEYPSFTFALIASNCLLLCDFTGEAWIISVFWTLAIEAQYYILIALSVPFLLSPGRITRLSVFGLWILAPLVAGNGPTVFTWSALFAIGIATWLLRDGRIGILEFVIAVLLSFIVHSTARGWLSALVGTMTALAILFPFDLRRPSLAWIGSISYSLYLIHIPVGGRVVNLAARLPDSLWTRLITIALALSVSLVAASIFFHFIEKPSHDWARRLRRKHKRG